MNLARANWRSIFRMAIPSPLADRVVLFKRLARQAAREHGMHDTFMAKPIAEHAGSSMHLHMSVVDEAGSNLFAGDDGADSVAFSISSAACKNICLRSRR